MRVSEAMTRDVRLATPDETIEDAAKMMAEIDAGILPFRDGDRLVGMITDRGAGLISCIGLVRFGVTPGEA
jgi:CBS domain-containing protein